MHILCMYYAYTMHILCIYCAYTMHILCIYYAYTMHILCIYSAYTMHIFCLYYSFTLHILCIYYAYSMHILCIYYAYTFIYMHILAYTMLTNMHVHAYAVQIRCIYVMCISYYIILFLPHQKVQSHFSVAFAHQLDLGEDHGSKVLSSPAQRSYPRAWRWTDRGHQCRWLVNPGGICFEKMT